MKRSQSRLCLPIGLAAAVAGFIACSHGAADDSAAKVVGGVATSAHPGVIRLIVDKKQGAEGQAGQRTCTGVIVGNNAALMAAHCIDANTAQDGVFAETAAGEKQSKFFYAWGALVNAKALSKTESARDLAVVVFPPNTFPDKASYARVWHDAMPTAGTPVTIVGFGASSLAGDGANVKREGTNVLGEVADELIKVSGRVPFSPANAVAAPGDSGGPLFATIDGQEVLLGIGSAIAIYDAQHKPLPFGSPQAASATAVDNYFINLGSRSALQLLSYALIDTPKHGGAVGLGAMQLEIQGFVKAQAIPVTEADLTWRQATGGSMQRDLTPMCFSSGKGGNPFNPFGNNNNISAGLPPAIPNPFGSNNGVGPDGKPIIPGAPISGGGPTGAGIGADAATQALACESDASQCRQPKPISDAPATPPKIEPVQDEPAVSI